MKGQYATYTGKIGIGTTVAAIASNGYYEGEFTTLEVYEFEPVFNVDTGDLVSVTTGSGVHTQGDVSLQFSLGDPAGGTATTSSAIAQSAFISGQKISILDITGGLVFPNYRITTDSVFNFTVAQNADVFGTYTKNFGVRNDVVNYDGTTQRSEFYLYGNDLYVDNFTYQDSGGIYKNESDNSGNFSPPSTGAMGTYADGLDAIKYFNNQQLSESGILGDPILTVSFLNDPKYTDYSDSIALWASTVSPDFETNEGNLLFVDTLRQIQKGQRVDVVGLPTNRKVYLKAAVSTPEAITQTIYPIDVTVESPVEGKEVFFPVAGGTINGQVYIDKDPDGAGGCLSVEHYATTTGGGKLQYSAGESYLTTEDITGTGHCCTLQETTSAGNTSTVPVQLRPHNQLP